MTTTTDPELAQTESIQTPDEPAAAEVDAPSPGVLAARHGVGVLLLMLLQHPNRYEAYGFWFTWLGAALGAFVAAGLLAGLAWVFFTNRERGRFLRSFAISSWFFAVLSLMNQWVFGN